MTKFECKQITDSVATLSDEELEMVCHEAIYDAAGSQADIMEELCYDEADVKERRDYEKWLGEKADLLMDLCRERGIKLWSN